MDGWTPTEVHQHFDREGRLTGTTVVTREPAWDEESRERAMSLAMWEDSLCPCGCGLPASEASDPKRAYRVQEYVCYARRAIERHQRAEKERAGKQSEEWSVGRAFYVDDSFAMTDGRVDGGN